MFTDGTSNTLCAAEVKAYTPYLRNTADPGPAVPASPGFAAGLTGDGCCIGPTLQQNTGHTEWADGLCQQSGFTTTFTPNTRIPYTVGGAVYDEVTLRDAWGTPIVFMPAMHPAIGMALGNRPFFVSAGPDRMFRTLEDNLYSYEQGTPEVTE